MNRYEKESLIKNFIIFFSMLEILLILLFWQIYHNKNDEYKNNILRTMELCSYSLDCSDFIVDFSKKNDKTLNHLYFNKKGIDSYFIIPTSKKYDIHFHYTNKKYNRDKSEIILNLIYKIVILSLILSIIATLLTLYSLSPIRKALKLNDEFIKDILHDFNTPIASMVLNINMYNRFNEDNKNIENISKSIDNILLLQNNLKTFLHHSSSQVEKIDISLLAKDRVDFISSLYTKINFEYKIIKNFTVITNRELLIRIIDNILTNASKYNKIDGLVTVIVDKDSIIIKDTGKGIKDINKVLDRYYKEQDRGLGLGLHIVKKLTDELNINLLIKSKINYGTRVYLLFRDIGNPK
jgi:signal transduction histidine kinase